MIDLLFHYNPLTYKVDEIDLNKIPELLLNEIEVDEEIDSYKYSDSLNHLRGIYDNNKMHLYVNALTRSDIIEYLKETLYSNNGVEYDSKSIDAWSITFSKNNDKSKALPDNVIEFNIDQPIYYVINQANLIMLGQGLVNGSNKVLENVYDEAKNGDKITFKITDNDLKRDGYTYQIYYLSDRSLSSIAYATVMDLDFFILDKDGKIIGYDIPKLVGSINRYKLETTRNVEVFATLSDALKKHNEFDKRDDTVPIVSATQNFFVIYTPIETRKQDFYILSENDPYLINSVTRQLAIPKTIGEAQQSSRFKFQGQTGMRLIPGDPDSGLSINAYNTYSMLNDKDLEHLSVYQRSGYYIDKATYQVTDQNGQNHIITFTVQHDKNNNSNDSDVILLRLLNYLASSDPDDNSNSCQFELGENGTYQIIIDGLNAGTLSSDKLSIAIPFDQTWTFDDTEYNNDDKKNNDPSPQILTLHYAALPISENENSNINIHYVDVDDIAPLSSDQIKAYENDGIVLNLATNKYAYSQIRKNHEFVLNADESEILSGQDTPAVSFKIFKTDQQFDNTAKDKLITDLLREKGYVVVQRDKQTQGLQKYDFYSTDRSNGSVDGNIAISYDNHYGWPNGGPYGGYFSNQNYYVYLKKQAQYPVNYQVLVEDEDGNIEKNPLVNITELGVGGQNEDIATSLADPTGKSLETLEQKYKNIINDLKTQYQNYEFVLEPTDNQKLKVTDKISGNFSNTEPRLFTIYVTHKKGNVTIHYIDVNGSNKTSNYRKDDGRELTDHVQAITDKNYGDTYNNSLWDYASDHYVLASDIPATATSGTISKPNDDIYIYLKHATTTTTQTATLHENIKYQYNDGKSAGDDYNRTINYSRTQTHDLVDNTDSAWSEWKPEDNTSFEDVKSKVIQGYTADKLSVPAPTPVDADYENGKTHNYNYTVVYSPDGQKAILRFYDDTDQKFIEVAPDIDATGKSNGNINFNIQHDFSNYDFVVVAKGDDPKNIDSKLNGKDLSSVVYGKFDTDKNTDQYFIAHFIHKKTPINESKTIKETIHYVYEDGTKAHEDFTGVPVTFTRDGEHDEVTNTDNWNNWKSEKDSFDAVTSPEIAGYTPDIELVSEISVKPTDSDIVRKVTYRADKQKAILRFYDDTDQKYIEKDPSLNTTGKSNENISFDIPYDFSNYDFVVVAKGDDPKNIDSKLTANDLSSVAYGKFDTDKNRDQYFIAHFTHKTKPVEGIKTVTETIHYVYKGWN